MPGRAAADLVQSLRDLRESTYLYDGTGGRTLGLHVSLYKVRPEADQPFEQRFCAAAARDGQEPDLLEGAPEPSLEAGHRTLKTIGYWDWVRLEYVDDICQPSTRITSQLEAQARKSIYGYLLATNAAVKAGWVVGPPWGLPAQSVASDPGILAHYKLHPLLHFTGRSDLVIHTAQFAALLLSADDGFWESELAGEAWERVHERLHPERAEAAQAAQETRLLIRRLRELRTGVRYIVFRNMGWTDLSVYLMGPDQAQLARLAFVLSDIPVLYPRFVWQTKVLLSKQLDGDAWPLGRCLDHASARADEDLMNRLFDVCKHLNETRDPTAERWEFEASRYVPELPVFCDYAEVLTHPGSASAGVTYHQMVDVKPGRLSALLEHVERATGTPPHVRLVSGPADICLTPATVAPDLLEDKAVVTWLQSKATIALVDLETSLLYKRRHWRGSLLSAVRHLLHDLFTMDDWQTIADTLLRLEVSKNLRHSVATLVLPHLAYKCDPTMADDLFDYARLWRSLRARLDAMKEPPPSDVDVMLEENLATFVEKVAAALNAIYTSSSAMLEVADLHHNHSSSVNAVLHAYSELIPAAVEICRYVDETHLCGIVKVGEQRSPLTHHDFGSVVEMDWLRLWCPEESGFAILHELGHQVLSDPALRVVRLHADNATVWRGITRRACYEEGGYFTFSRVRDLFVDVFCDLFMLRILTCSLRSQQQQASSAELRQFFDRWYWTQAQTSWGTARGVQVWNLYERIARWHLVRSTLDRVTGARHSDETAVELVRQRLEDAGAAGQWTADEVDAHIGVVDRQQALEAPPSESEWHALMQLIGRLCPIIRDRHDAPESGEVFCAEARCAITAYLRPYDGGRNPARFFINLSTLALHALLPDPSDGTSKLRSTGLAAISAMYGTAIELFDAMLAAPGRVAFLEFDGKGNARRHVDYYAPVVVNPRGSVFIRDRPLRLKIFGQRLQILEMLNESRLRRIGMALSERAPSGTGGAEGTPDGR